MKEWTIIRDIQLIIMDIQLCPNKPTATAAAKKPTFDCVPCIKSFSKIHFLFVFSIFLPLSLIASLLN